MVSDRLWGHPAWSLTLDRLGDAGVKFIERTGEVGPPTPVQSGTGGDVVDGFDPEWIVRVVGGSPGA